MPNKFLLSTIAAAALMFTSSAYSHEEGKEAKKDAKEHVHCDPAKDKNCKDEHTAKEHKDGDKHDHKAGDKHDHKEGEGHSKDKH